MGERILVIDDEYQITRVLKRALTANRYDVRTASDGEAGIDLFGDFQPGLVITDLSMPGISGTEVCRRIRQTSTVPLIVLSVKGDERTKVEALDAGADDYVTKPFGIDELLARVRAALRRTPPDDHQKRIESGDFVVDLSEHSVSIKGKNIHLTPKEFELLTFMIQNHRRVLTHRVLLAKIWGTDHTEQPEYLRVFIGNLRKKIEPVPSKPCYILTEPWVGYRFTPGP